MNKKYDFLISGAGLVGALTALQLTKHGHSCCLIEKNNLSKNSTLKNYAPLSLNYRSFLILKKFGLWDQVEKFAYPIKKLNLKSFSSLNRLSLKSTDIGLNNLGYVVDRRSLLSSFLDALTQSSKVDIIENNYIQDIEVVSSKDDCIISKIESGKTIESNYLIVSDGIDSRIKNMLNIDSEIIDYSQSSYIYNAKADFEENTAIQIFNKHGIFAAIPYEKDYLSLVLSLDKKYEEKYFNSGKPNEDSISAIYKKYIKNIGNFEFVSKYSLVTSRANNIIKDNILLLGNSSQLLHPVGAQGFNLALRNLETLLNCIQVDSDFSNVSDLINSDRESAFSNVDYATNIFASDMLFSKIITFTTYNLVKSSPTLKTKFLEKILGLEGYPYLSIGTK